MEQSELWAKPLGKTERVELLLRECREKLALLDEARDVELQKSLRERRMNYLIFLDKERSAYAFGISLLMQLEDEATDGR